MIKLPELIVKEIIDEFLEYIITDYNTSAEKDTFLYQVFKGNSSGNFDFYEQAKDIFLRDEKNLRKIDTRIMFDTTRATLPTIHIVLPSENQGKANAIGINRNDNFFYEREDNSVQHMYGRSFGVNYQLGITSGNPFQTILIYQGLKAGLIACMDTFELQGLRVNSIAGGDLDLNPDILPNTFARHITLSIDYTLTVPSLIKQKFNNKIKAHGKPTS